MPAQKKKHMGRKLLAALVLVLLVLLSVINIELLSKPLEKFFQQDLLFEEFVDALQEGYTSDDFVYKNDFVNLNGLFARLTGRRTLNNVVKLNNGMLSAVVEDRDMTDLISAITGFAGYLREQDTPFLYVQLPYKESLDGQSFPAGLSSHGNQIADEMLERLQAKEFETLDLRPLLSQTPEMLERYFYKTDHHWNSDGAFVGFQEILNYLNKMFPEANIDLTYAQADQWERHTLDDWSLGSWGKRVGIYFDGTDPLIWHTPKFETELSCAIPEDGLFYRGDFTEANIYEKCIEEKDYFEHIAYSVYIGGDYPLVQHRNLYAPSPLKVMLIKDSFSLPLQAFLSTVFQEIDVIDPRYFEDCTVAEYAARTAPDLVILAINPDWPGEEQDYGEKDAISLSAEDGAEENASEPAVQQDIKIEARDIIFNYAPYPLDANTAYRVSFAGVDVLEGETGGAGLRLYDRTTEEILENAIFDLAYCEAADGFHWTFRTPDTQDEYQLLFYAGIYAHTAGNSVVYRDVAVEKLSFDAP